MSNYYTFEINLNRINKQTFFLDSGSIKFETEADQHLQASNRAVTYQASSPDEVALVQWTQDVGMALSRRDLSSMQLKTSDGRLLNYAILNIFPFTSETKRMGIIVKVIIFLIFSSLLLIFPKNIYY